MHAPQHLLVSLGTRQRLFDDLLPVMEEWSGQKLKSTSCYGVRHYYRDSVLANHVDRIDTHVISGIINVAQVRVLTGPPSPTNCHRHPSTVSEKHVGGSAVGRVPHITLLHT